MKRLLFFVIAVSMFAFGCSESPKSGQTNGQDSTSVKNSNEKKVNIKANASGKFVCSDGHQNQKLVGDRDNAAEWESFTLIKKGGDKIALKAYNGKYVCADLKKDGILIADREAVEEWESFTMITEKDNKVAFKASNNKYVSCDQKLKGELIANRDTVGDWELFTVIYK
jgi:hypothetical protein